MSTEKPPRTVRLVQQHSACRVTPFSKRIVFSFLHLSYASETTWLLRGSCPHASSRPRAWRRLAFLTWQLQLGPCQHFFVQLAEVKWKMRRHIAR